MKKVLGCIRRADERFSLIREGDNILIGVSGGKDSVLLMQALSLYRRFCKLPFTLRAVTMDMGLAPVDFSPIAALAKELSIPYEIVPTDIGKIVFERRKEPNPCALCAKMRRGAINEYAQKHGCTKVALGHHREDVLETLLLSLLYEGRINTFSPITYLDRTGVTLIRPMVFLSEKHIIHTVRALSLPVCKSVCPADKATKREEMGELLNHLISLVPNAPVKMINALTNTHSYNLWDKLKLPPQ